MRKRLLLSLLLHERKTEFSDTNFEIGNIADISTEWYFCPYEDWKHSVEMLAESIQSKGFLKVGIRELFSVRMNEYQN